MPLDTSPRWELDADVTHWRPMSGMSKQQIPETSERNTDWLPLEQLQVESADGSWRAEERVKNQEDWKWEREHGWTERQGLYSHVKLALHSP